MKVSTDPKVKAYVKLVRSSEALHSQVSRGLAVEGLSASQFSTLKVLRIYGRLSQRDIAKLILKSDGNITVLVDNLESMELVTRDRDKKDRRVVYVQLTAKGEKFFDELYPSHISRIKESMQALSESDCSVLLELLEKIFPNLPEAACVAEAALAAK